MAKALVQWSLGPGFESQVPQNLCFYFFLYVHMQDAQKSLPCASRISVPCGPRLGSNGKGWVTTMLPVNKRSGGSQKVNGLGWLLGLKIANKPPYLGHHPPWFIIPLLFSFPFLFSFINYNYYYYLINIINYFHNKIRKPKYFYYY